MHICCVSMSMFICFCLDHGRRPLAGRAGTFFVCLYVCVSIYPYTCMYKDIYIYISIYIYIYICVLFYTYLLIQVPMRICVV
jgi:hypothetical protein